MESRKRNDAAYEEFFNSLSAEQRNLYEKHWTGQLEEYTMGLTEHFNMGMCTGLRLALELLKT